LIKKLHKIGVGSYFLLDFKKAAVKNFCKIPLIKKMPSALNPLGKKFKAPSFWLLLKPLRAIVSNITSLEGPRKQTVANGI
jgi:hypothetical protein